MWPEGGNDTLGPSPRLMRRSDLSGVRGRAAMLNLIVRPNDNLHNSARSQVFVRNRRRRGSYQSWRPVRSIASIHAKLNEFFETLSSRIAAARSSALVRNFGWLPRMNGSSQSRQRLHSSLNLAESSSRRPSPFGADLSVTTLRSNLLLLLKLCPKTFIDLVLEAHAL